MNKFLSYLAIVFALVYFIMKLWYHVSYDQSDLALTADYKYTLIINWCSELKIGKDRFCVVLGDIHLA